MNKIILYKNVKKIFLISLSFIFIRSLNPIIESISLYRHPSSKQIILNIGERHASDGRITRIPGLKRDLEISGKQKFIELLNRIKPYLRTVLNFEVQADASGNIVFASTAYATPADKRDLPLTFFHAADQKKTDLKLTYNFADCTNVIFAQFAFYMNYINSILYDLVSEALPLWSRSSEVNGALMPPFTKLLIENGCVDAKNHLDLYKTLSILVRIYPSNPISRQFFDQFATTIISSNSFSRFNTELEQRFASRDFRIENVSLQNYLGDYNRILTKVENDVIFNDIRSVTEVKNKALSIKTSLEDVGNKYPALKNVFLEELVKKAIEAKDFSSVIILLNGSPAVCSWLQDLGYMWSLFSSLQNADIVINFLGNAHINNLNHLALDLGFVQVIQEGDPLALISMAEIPKFSSVENFSTKFDKILPFIMQHRHFSCSGKNGKCYKICCSTHGPKRNYRMAHKKVGK
ncbi:TPA: hypothetical protein DEO28_04310 [Candidatus Dependentiae bacterium]|nr:MAG: hypothetical protein UR14_C0006G0099 [candidate division TM6 bacterium GW2011_GWE2_31_21]KKP53478.1 MAG: hypothetical protein UR43_C0004G0019 [candidate division TM6 bacterium GW2011_GWF2_33_332]HBS48280.1 hypothetical protein [Candidatus Dependentiae bacterium]HBZ73707.1 hypothetical protein [Candidatus Dependentiae bacterium]